MIGYEETEVLDVRPAEYFVRVIKREKRACRDCEEQGVQTAPVPERICPKSVLSDQLIVEAMVGKYCASLPLYRQQAIIKRDAGVQIALSTLNDGVLRVGELLIPIAAAMKREVLAGTYIQADETPIGVQTHDKRGRNHQAYMWLYGSPGKGVVFDFRMGREGEGPKQFLGNFNGLLQTDGYAGYNHVGGPKMVHACCLAHARRKFVDAVKINAKDQESARIVALMDELFAIDREAREQNLDHAQRDVLRQERAPRVAGKVAQRGTGPEENRTAQERSRTGGQLHAVVLEQADGVPQISGTRTEYKPGGERDALHRNRQKELAAHGQQGSWTEDRRHLLGRRELPAAQHPHPEIPWRCPSRTCQPLHPIPR